MAAQDAQIAEQIRQTAHQWRTLIASPHATDRDRAQFEVWRRSDPRHEQAYDRAVTVWDALGQLKRDDYRDDYFEPTPRERIVGIFRSKLNALANAKFRLAMGVFTAAMCVFWGLFLLQLNYGTKPLQGTEPIVASYATGARQSLNIALDDGTSVILGAGSEIETSFTHKAREVRLIAGAALFNVVSDAARPFSVSAGDLTAKAIGTQFGVRNSGGIYRVAVAEGEVEVSFPYKIGGRSTAMTVQRSLHVGQQIAASIDNGLRSVKSIDVAEVGAWRHNRLVYDGATIAELVADANRYDTRTIVIADGAEEIALLKLTGSFSGDNIDRMLLTLQDVHPVTVDTSDPDTIRLRRRSDDD